MPERVLVTGGAGFIGSHIVEAMINAGHTVAIVDNLHTGKIENVNPRAEFFQVDIRDSAALERVFTAVRPSVISHQAALANVRGSLEYPDQYAEVNVIGTLRLLEVARRHGVRKVMMASTGGAIYGELPQQPATEDSVAHPLDPYGASKLACEHYLFTYRHNYGLDYCALRYGNVYGPRQDMQGEAGVVAIFAGRMLSQQPVVINGDGLQQRDFVYVADIARANVLAVDHGSGIYNIGTGVPTNINTVAHHLAKLADYTLSEEHGPAKPGEVRTSCLGPARAMQELQWRSQVSLTEGLARTVAWYREVVQVV
ncbi:MAG: SDR family NAD(P)-dependent oxidoreductase [Chloroflexi bacterium]|nr:SDR family NAD(P)-dependent oxidoreductase [Chloroflexota bacterium]